MKIGYLILILLIANDVKADVGCKIHGGNQIYLSYNTYLLGVKINGINIGIPSYVYSTTASLSTDMSCTMPWVNSSNIIGSCTYGTPLVGLPGLAAVCTNCVSGDLVDYTTTLECDLDRYTYLLGLGLGIFGLTVIRKRNE